MKISSLLFQNTHKTFLGFALSLNTQKVQHDRSFDENIFLLHMTFFSFYLTSAKKMCIIVTFTISYRDIAKSVKAQDFDSCISLVRVQLSLP